ncbi:hypothetical protein BXU06_02180 [Aquaspirillum sp. LM1]|uniref:KGGVGR-motif variant AAA ATPase n=1 Tax=Aquaspirillum sp. LM1 TaxID=1938604 RepID=UPI000983E658|nr:hypothetical protein [Aquaspirillum sp. LM1]AQR63999.1 hypothetical protein BXU06_02180 [Aquaspirillum sp. LM1]
MPTPSKTPFIAFYSYKGGVGRTLALANCARSLAARGHTVAIIDLDLEAPGLEAFDAFRPNGEAPGKPESPHPPLTGFAEYIAHCREQGAPPTCLSSYFHLCVGKPGDRGKVYLMPAGRRGEAAYRDILSFDWDRFYQDEDGYRFMENLRGHIAHNLGDDENQPIRPDYVLIDARTGLSETGGIATHQLADLVVLLFNLNRQNLEGTRWVHDSLAKLDNPPAMLLAISPIPELEEAEGTVFRQRLQSIGDDLKHAANATQPLRIPYRPVLSLEERIATDEEEDRRADYHLPYERVLDAILRKLKAPDIYLDEASRAIRDNQFAEAVEWLKNGLVIYPEHPALLEMLAQLDGDADTVRIDFTHLPAGATHFLGRDDELAILDAAWDSAGATALVELIAPGGGGKSALVKRWLDTLKTANWRGARRVFAWSFYSLGSGDERNASEDLFLAEAIKFFGVAVEASLNPADKGRALAEAVVARRSLLVLDGLEPLQHPPGPLAGELRAPGLKALLTHLATAGRPGLALLTSREALKDLDEWANSPSSAVRRIDLGNLSDADGARLLHAEGANKAGSAPITADDAELKEASRQVKGHALTLSLLGSYLALAHENNIRQRDQVDWAEADAETKGGQAFRIIAAYEHWFAGEGSASRELAALRLFGFFDRPATQENLAALRAAPAIAGLTEALIDLKPAQWNATLKRLQTLRLLDFDPASGRLDAHPLLREYFAATLSKNQPEAWREGHRRLYQQLKNSAPHQPGDLAGLQPLYQAVVHGCWAGLHQEALNEVYIDRILRGTGPEGFYSTRQLGALGSDLGAVGRFFIEPWRRLAPDLPVRAQAWLLDVTAFNLRALGRLAEAIEPMRAGVEMRVAQAAWQNAAIGYGNLSELQLSLGRIALAVTDAERAVDYADRSGDAFFRMVSRTTLADAHHQQGEQEAAHRGFAEAEAMQAEGQPEYPLLYSLQGFRYGELLLAEAERAAWGEPAAAEGREACTQVARRAAQTLAWAEIHLGLLDIALAQLILARCALYADLLHGRPPGQDAQLHTETAVASLRQAGQQQYLPLGLLTRAWLHHCLNDRPGAEADLAEAQRIAERGGMKLHLVDIALTRARLFNDTAELARARALIEECGYGRRLAELTDAETRLGNCR